MAGLKLLATATVISEPSASVQNSTIKAVKNQHIFKRTVSRTACIHYLVRNGESASIGDSSG